MSAVIRIDILGDSRSAQRSARDAERGYDRLGRGADRSSRNVGKLGTAMGTAARRYGPLAALGAAYGILKIGKDSITAASKVEQSFGAIDAVFGKNSKAVKRWAKSAADDLGLAKSEYAELAVVTGAMLKNTGIENYASQTKTLLKLGADLAAQYGGTTKQAVQDIGSLMRGETDPIEKYGVSIKQATVAAYLHAKGLDGLKGKQKTQAEQQARIALLFQQSRDAQGAFARESDTLATSQQKLGAKWENLSATLGQKLLPVAVRVTQWLVDTIDGSNRTGEALRKIGEVYVSYVTPILEGAREGWQKFNEKLDDATGESDSFRKAMIKVGKWVEENAPRVGRVLGKTLEKIGTFAGYAAIGISNIVTAVRQLARWIDTALGPLDELARKLGNFNLDKLGKIASLGFGGGGGGGGRGGGLLDRSAFPYAGTLGRGLGMGAFAGAGGGTINVTTQPQFNLVVDTHALRDFIRMETRAEISTQVRQARSNRR